MVCQKQDSLQAELAVAEVEKVLEGGTKEVENHGIIITFGSEPPDEGNTDTTGESLVNFGLIFELGMFGFHRFELNGDFLARNDIDSEVNVTYKSQKIFVSAEMITISQITVRTKGARTNLLSKPIFTTDPQVQSVRRAIGHRLEIDENRVYR